MPHCRLLVFILVTALSACAERGAFSEARDAPEPPVSREVFVASMRAIDQAAAFQPDSARAVGLSYGRFKIAIPQAHEPGVIEWPGRDNPDPAKHFYVAEAEALPGARSLSAALRARVAKRKRSDREVVIYVHGFNTNMAEAVYGLAQIAHDFQTPGPDLVFTWASAGDPRGYLYDRDSVLLARDGLADVLVNIARQSGMDITIVGHSMGAQLIMETLRQVSLSDQKDVMRSIASVLLVAPDIDIDVFKSQFAALDPVPAPMVLFVSQNDHALRLSARLSGRTSRLGTIEDIKVLSELDLTVVDVTDLGNGGGLNHAIPTTSPAAIAFFNAQMERRASEGLTTTQATFFENTANLLENTLTDTLTTVFSPLTNRP